VTGSPILEVRELRKSFGKVNAVNGVSFAIPEGSCFGLLGPNGAGKTTTVEMMEGIKEPSAGEILFRGRPIGDEFKERTGIQFQETALQDYLTVKEVLKLFQSFYRRTTPLEELARLCALEEFWDRDHDKLSGGQRQRVLLAIALVNDPDIIFLDEPTTGLDPQARRNFWSLIQAIKARRKTVVLTTHYMEEAYTLCDEIAIMDRGRIIARGAPDHLLKQHFEGVTVELPREDLAGADLSRLTCRVAEIEGKMSLHTTEVAATLKELLAMNVPLQHLSVRSRTLEDLFIELTGREIRG
jgi:ABC-2 type transport system ATP-binding protein